MLGLISLNVTLPAVAPFINLKLTTEEFSVLSNELGRNDNSVPDSKLTNVCPEKLKLFPIDVTFTYSVGWQSQLTLLGVGVGSTFLGVGVDIFSGVGVGQIVSSQSLFILPLSESLTFVVTKLSITIEPVPEFQY